jgi:hypothetical protein
MINLLSDNQALSKPILDAISVELVKFIRNFYHVEMEKDSKERFRSFVSNLFQMVASEVSCLWTALKNLLQHEIMALKEDSQRVDAIDLITFTLTELQPSITSNLVEDNKNQAFEQEQLSRMLVPIVSELLAGLERLCQSTFGLD